VSTPAYIATFCIAQCQIEGRIVRTP